MWNWFHQLSSPPHFYRIAGYFIPWTGWLAFVTIAISLYGGLVLAPADYLQGDAFRIIYVHVPSAWMSMFVYVAMAVASAIGLIWRMKLAHVAAVAIAPIGAAFTALALATGSIWGRPTWGTWWVWDGRLTSELFLLFLYLGFMALHAAFDDARKGDRMAAILAVVGVVNIPIIHYSVVWWNTLHQPASVTKLSKPTIDGDMLWPLLLMLLGFMLYFISVALVRARTITLLREQRNQWVRELP